MDQPPSVLSGADPMDPARMASAVLTVEGMHCQSCALLIEEVLLEDSSVSSAVVDFDAARAVVTYLPATTSVEDLCDLVAGAGYQASPAP